MRVSTSGGDYFFAARMNDENSDFVDIHLEGAADGWVAVGFTTSKTMVSILYLIRLQFNNFLYFSSLTVMYWHVRKTPHLI